jgi:two-component system OmpR family sensor kinase
MSIRLRLTLLYSGILALTLIAFSVMLYVTQAQATLTEAKRELAKRAEFVVSRRPPHWTSDKSPPFLRTKIGTIFQARTLDGEVLDRSPNLEDSITLPLSEEGLLAVRRGETWVEIGVIESERLLIQSQLYSPSEDDSPVMVQVATSLADQDQNLATLGRILIIGSSVAVIAAFGIGWLLAGLALRPINRLRQTAQTIGDERDFNRRMDHIGPNDELGQLTTTFNNMLAELQAAYLQVEETLQVQRRFVADASHELRTPLTTLRGNIGLLQRQPPISAEDQTDVLTDMVDETERLMRLVNDLLALARVDAQQPWRNESIRLKPLLEDVCRQMRLLAPERTIVCQSDLDLTIKGNEDALKQVLLGLLDNALKYTPPETTITLATGVVDEHITICVRDSGPGIKPSQLPHIFDRFYRGDTARTGGSAGLGLAIAKELTEAQNGVINVKSEIGQGSVFTLTFPKPPQVA